MENMIAAVLTVIITIIAGIVPAETPYWFVPLAGGIVSIYGLFSEKEMYIDIGILSAIMAFLLIHQKVRFSPTNLFLIVIVFFLLVASMIFNRRALLTSRIRMETEGGEEEKSFLRDFEIKSIRSLATDLVIAFGVTFIGAIVAVYSSLGLNLSSGTAVPVVLIFSVMFFVVLYVIVRVLPKYRNK